MARAGYALLLASALLLVVRSASPALISICTALMTVNLVDNATALPSLFFAEVFWIAVGIGQASVKPDEGVSLRLTRDLVSSSLSGIVLFIVYLFPLWFSLRPQSAPTIALTSFVTPQHWRPSEDNPVYMMLNGAPAPYRVVLRACAPTCRTLFLTPITIGKDGIWDRWTHIELPAGQTVRLLLEVFPQDNPPWRMQPLLRRSWLLTP